jgi:hypothetical protein
MGLAGGGGIAICQGSLTSFSSTAELLFLSTAIFGTATHADFGWLRQIGDTGVPK